MPASAAHGALDGLADQALVGDAALGGAGADSLHQRRGQAHVDAGGLGLRLPGEGGEGGQVEAGEILVEEGLGLVIGGHLRNRARVQARKTAFFCQASRSWKKPAYRKPNRGPQYEDCRRPIPL